MKRITFMLLILAFALSMIVPTGVVKAQVASTQTWTSSIYYYNPTENSGTLVVTYYDETGGTKGTTSIDNPIQVEGHGSGEVFIGEVNVPTGFKGSAVLTSEVPLVAVYEQSPNTNPNFARLLYSAFDVSQQSTKIYVPSLMNDPKTYISQVGVQNTSAGKIDLKVTIYDAAGAVKKTIERKDADGNAVATNASYIFQANQLDLPTGLLDASAVIEVTSADGAAVAAVEELQATGRRAYAFEGVTNPTTSVFMPSALCKSGRGGQTTTFSIQNTSDTDVANVKLNGYLDTTGAKLNKTDVTVSIPANGKATVPACKVITSGKSGSALITSNTNIAVVAKVVGSDGLSTAYTGQTAPSTRVVLPYVLWAANQAKGYRATISVMNVGNAPITNLSYSFWRNDLNNTNVNAVLPKGGLPQYAKVTVDPAKARAVRVDGNFRGALEVNADQPVVVIVRMERKNTGVSGYAYFGEDYTGIPYNP